MIIYVFRDMCFLPVIEGESDWKAERVLKRSVDFIFEILPNGIVKVIKKQDGFNSSNYFFNIRDAIHHVENFYDNNYEYDGIKSYTVLRALKQIQDQSEVEET